MLETINPYDYLIKQLNNNIRGLKAHRKILDGEEHEYLYPVFEKAMYIAIAATDLIIGLKYLDVSNAVKNGYETNYFSRNVAHISYELINYPQKMLGPDISKMIINNLGVEALSELKSCSNVLKEVTKQYHKKLKNIRNNLFGHRTRNGSEMAMSMLEINSIEIYKIGKRIFDAYINVFEAYINLIKKL